MSALEREVIDKFRQLQPDAQRRVLAFIERETAAGEPAAFDYEGWFREVELLRRQVQAGTGGIDGVGVLRDIR